MTKRCLIIMPFSDPDKKNQNYWASYERTLSDRIRAITGYNCSTCKIGAGHLLGQLIEEILGADLIVCDLTGHNPNVLFELGMAFLIEKPIILLLQGESQLPTDFNNHLFINYEFRCGEGGGLGELSIPRGKGEADLLKQSLLTATRARRNPELPSPRFGPDLRLFASLLQQIIQLQAADAMLAPALTSLSESMVNENAIRLKDFAEQKTESAVIHIESSKILFRLLTSLLEGLAKEDSYDSITWRQHWSGESERAAQDFLDAICMRGDDLPRMRRIFLVGVEWRDRRWIVNGEDIRLLRWYSRQVGPLYNRISNRILFLPEQTLKDVADRCHMGLLRRSNESLYVFSRYSRDGSLTTFKLTRDTNRGWDFDEFWDNSNLLRQAFMDSEEPIVAPTADVQFSFSRGQVRYEKWLKGLISRLKLT